MSSGRHSYLGPLAGINYAEIERHVARQAFDNLVRTAASQAANESFNGKTPITCCVTTRSEKAMLMSSMYGTGRTKSK